ELHAEDTRWGNWLFRHRSYLPVLLLPALAATLALPTQGGPAKSESLWQVICLSVSLLGFALRAWTVGTAPAGTSGRNTSRQVASRLNTDGPYSMVRNPLYLGNALMWLGLVMYARSLPLLLGIGLAFWLMYAPIIRAEEAFLRARFGPEFERWAACTPAFVPRPSRFRPASLPFSLRNVLRREYSGFAALLLVFGMEVIIRHRAVTGRWDVGAGWLALEGGAVVSYLVLRTLKRHTRLLHVAGR
ncbi:MAG TPA: isoprenylcysteine carboxylmethyltransferase family protein, partial [Longimicrobium sp.]|nr:isoprenylcysteine carboxylmethyltransferase family protein [Longimicrobium sp.]